MKRTSYLHRYIGFILTFLAFPLCISAQEKQSLQKLFDAQGNTNTARAGISSLLADDGYQEVDLSQWQSEYSTTLTIKSGKYRFYNGIVKRAENFKDGPLFEINGGAEIELAPTATFSGANVSAGWNPIIKLNQGTVRVTGGSIIETNAYAVEMAVESGGSFIMTDGLITASIKNTVENNTNLIRIEGGSLDRFAVYSNNSIYLAGQADVRSVSVYSKNKPVFLTSALDHTLEISSSWNYDMKDSYVMEGSDYTLTDADVFFLNINDGGKAYFKSLENNRVYLRENGKEVTISDVKPGTLEERMTKDECNSAETLIITGSLNGTDIAFLRKLLLLHRMKLNLWDANIVSGGDMYRDIFNKQYYTNDNEVGDYMFNDNYMQEIILPRTVTKIGFEALGGYQTRKITIGPAVTTFSMEGSFWGCSKLEEVVFVDNQNFRVYNHLICDKDLTTIYGTECASLGDNPTIPATVTRLSKFAFSDCKNVKTFNIPSSIDTLATNVFCGCSNLVAVTLPNSMKMFGDLVFQNCSSLTTFNVPTSLTEIGGNLFSGAYKITKADFSNTKIARIVKFQTFGSSNLIEVRLPSTLRQIEYSTFQGSDKLADIYCYAATPPSTIGYYSYKQFYQSIVTKCRLHIPKGSGAAYRAANGWKDFTNIVEDLPTPAFDLQGAIDLIANSGNPGTKESPVDIELPNDQEVLITKQIHVKEVYVRLKGGRIKLDKSFTASGDSVVFYIGGEATGMFVGTFPGGLWLSNVTIDCNNVAPRHAFFLNWDILNIEQGVNYKNISPATGIDGRGFYNNFSAQLSIASGDVSVKQTPLYNGGNVTITGGSLSGNIPIVNYKTVKPFVMTGAWSSSVNIEGGVINAGNRAIDLMTGSHESTSVNINGGTINAPVLTNNGGLRVNINGGNLNVKRLTEKSYPVDDMFTSLDYAISGEVPLNTMLNYPIKVPAGGSFKWNLEWGFGNPVFDKYENKDYFAIIESDTMIFKLQQSDFKNMTFNGVPDSLRIYYDANLCAVCVKHKTAVPPSLQELFDTAQRNSTPTSPVTITIPDEEYTYHFEQPINVFGNVILTGGKITVNWDLGVSTQGIFYIFNGGSLTLKDITIDCEPSYQPKTLATLNEGMLTLGNNFEIVTQGSEISSELIKCIGKNDRVEIMPGCKAIADGTVIKNAASLNINDGYLEAATKYSPVFTAQNVHFSGGTIMGAYAKADSCIIYGDANIALRDSIVFDLAEGAEIAGDVHIPCQIRLNCNTSQQQQSTAGWWGLIEKRLDLIKVGQRDWTSQGEYMYMDRTMTLYWNNKLDGNSICKDMVIDATNPMALIFSDNTRLVITSINGDIVETIQPHTGVSRTYRVANTGETVSAAVNHHLITLRSPMKYNWLIGSNVWEVIGEGPVIQGASYYTLQQSDFNSMKFVDLPESFIAYYDAENHTVSLKRKPTSAPSLQDLFDQVSDNGTEEKPTSVDPGDVDVDGDVTVKPDLHLLFDGSLDNTGKPQEGNRREWHFSGGNFFVSKGASVEFRNIDFTSTGGDKYIYVDGTLIIDINVRITSFTRFIHLRDGGRIVWRGGHATVSEVGIYNEGGTIEYRGGTIEGGERGFINMSGTIDIYDGEILGTTCGGHNMPGGIVRVHGGTISGMHNHGTLVVTGGWWKGSVSPGEGYTEKYTIVNYKDGHLSIDGDVVLGEQPDGSDGSIWSETDIYLGKAQMGDIHLAKTARIWVIRMWDVVIRLHFLVDGDFTPGQYIVMGYNGFLLDDDILTWLSILLDGHSITLDRTANAVCIDATDGIANVNGDNTVTDRYDMQGRRVEGKQRGLSVVRMSNGTVKKVMTK